jgi:ABC-2 type transport system permease protein
MGAVLGAIVPDVGDLLDSASAREMMARLGGEGAVERTLIGAELSVIAVTVAAFGIAVLAHGASDEESGRTAMVLATATSRNRTFAALTVVALAGVVWLLVVAGTAIAVGYGLAGDGVGQGLGDVLPAALVQVPAAAVAVGVGAVAFGTRASWTVAAWLALAAFVTLGQVGEALGLPDWAVGISPFTHTPAMPASAFSAEPVLALGGIAVALLGLAQVRYRRRDVA